MENKAQKSTGSQRIIPCLWFDGNAEEATNFYVSVFDNSEIGKISRYSESGSSTAGQPEGAVMTIAFKIAGLEFMALNGGPQFKISPSISFIVPCINEQEIDKLYESLSKDGSVLMPFDKYPFSEKYAWVQDRFGVSWQLSLTHSEQKIIPSLMFTGRYAGKTEEAINFYVSVFKNTKVNLISRYKSGEGDVEGTINYSSFTLAGQEFSAMDSSLDHKFSFNEAVSLLVNCRTQEEVDIFWEKLTAGGEEQVCGWLKDKFGVSWQVVPERLIQLLTQKDRSKADRVMNAMLKMKKINIQQLEEA